MMEETASMRKFNFFMLDFGNLYNVKDNHLMRVLGNTLQVNSNFQSI